MKFILGSLSKRRIEYLRNFGFDFEVRKVDFNEIIFENDPIKTAVYNAYMKAYLISLKENDLPILGVDTVVFLNNEIFGKPKDLEDNFQMLKKLVGKVHKVVSGVACVKGNNFVTDYEVTLVKFRDVEEVLLRKYVETKEGLDKAGGYAIQGLGAVLIDKVVGPLDNVIGVPILTIEKTLKLISEVEK